MARVRSYWGWGYEQSFPRDEARRELALRLGLVFGSALPLGALPNFDDVEMPSPRFALPDDLRRIGTDDRRVRALHTYGRSYRDLMRGYAGDFSSAPDWVFYPTCEEHIAALFRFCASESLALVPFGGGTGVVGGTEHVARGRFRGTASVDLTRMDKVLEVDSVSRAARIQGGASGPRIAEQLNPYGFALRHYPQSFELSTLGGWIATRAGGHYSTFSTRIDDFIESVRMITPAGILETRRLPSSGAGPSQDRWVLGSEGALGIITEAWVKVQSRPRWLASAIVRFDSFADAVAASRTLSQSGLFPSECRVLDAGETLLHQLAGDGSSLLFIAFESTDHPVDPCMERALSIASDLRGEAEDPKYTIDVVSSIAPRPSPVPPPPSAYPPTTIDHDVQRASPWREAFLDAPYLQTVLVSLGVISDSFEAACTWDRFPALHAAVTESLSRAMRATSGGAGLVACRISNVYPDGPVPSYTFLVPGRPGVELEQYDTIKAAATEALLANGGTFNHYQGVGRLHDRGYEQERSPLYGNLLSALKEQLDPTGLMNPGCLLKSKP